MGNGNSLYFTLSFGMSLKLLLKIKSVKTFFKVDFIVIKLFQSFSKLEILFVMKQKDLRSKQRC